MKAETHVAPATVPRALAQFFIRVTASLQERRPRTMKHSDTFAVFDHNGDALAGSGSPEGIYHRDTRYLSHLYMTVDGHGPPFAQLHHPRRQRGLDLRSHQSRDRRPRGRAADRPGPRPHPPQPAFSNARAFERLAISNYDTQARHLSLSITFAADFADIFEVRGTERARRGVLHPPAVEADAVTLAYTGLDGLRRETRLQFEPAPTRISPGEATFEIDLAPRAT